MTTEEPGSWNVPSEKSWIVLKLASPYRHTLIHCWCPSPREGHGLGQKDCLSAGLLAAVVTDLKEALGGSSLCLPEADTEHCVSLMPQRQLINHSSESTWLFLSSWFLCLFERLRLYPWLQGTQVKAGRHRQSLQKPRQPEQTFYVIIL